MISSPAGNDLLFDESSLEQGRNFNNKLWNALKLVKLWEGRQAAQNTTEITSSDFATTWFKNRLLQAKAEVDGLMKQFRLSEALKIIYSLIWDDFCSWYLEWVKPGFEQPIDSTVYQATIEFFEELLQLLHPYMPFVTEEIFHLLRHQNEDLSIKQFEEKTVFTENNTILIGQMLQESITVIRDARKKFNIKNIEKIKTSIDADTLLSFSNANALLILEKQTGIILSDKSNNSNEVVVTTKLDNTFYVQIEQEVDKNALKEDLLKDLQYQQNFLQLVMKKLGNERFVQNAKPEVIELEKKKQADAEARIKTIEESLENL